MRSSRRASGQQFWLERTTADLHPAVIFCAQGASVPERPANPFMHADAPRAPIWIAHEPGQKCGSRAEPSSTPERRLKEMSALPIDELKTPADVSYVGLDSSVIERSDSAFPPARTVEEGGIPEMKLPPPPASLRWYAESDDSIG
jgi:hypothetical protein